MEETPKETCQRYYDELRKAWIEGSTAGIIDLIRSWKMPTDDARAEAIWHLLSSYRGINAVEASRIYTECGYEAFAGFPLKLTQNARLNLILQKH